MDQVKHELEMNFKFMTDVLVLSIGYAFDLSFLSNS